MSQGKSTNCTEPPLLENLDCSACGACCREAYHVVEIEVGDPFLKLHPHLVTHDDGRFLLERPRGLCVALCESAETGYHCSVYSDRPESCRHFEVGGDNCHEARKRVGL